MQQETTPAFVPPAPEPVTIAGPAGPIEALLEVPASMTGRAAAVVCHPHPQHGGTMHNKVVHMLARSFQEAGVPTIRFNYRGVGHSAGTYDAGRGESDDAVAVMDNAASRWPDADLWLAGFSFGGAVAIRAAGKRRVRRLVLAAPAVQRLGGEDLPRLELPCLVVQGDQDDVIDPEHVRAWVQAFPSRPELLILPGAGHFFHGRLGDLRSAVRDWLLRQEGA